MSHWKVAMCRSSSTSMPRGEEFNVAKHVILPAVPFILLGIVIYFQFVPLPPAPFNLVGPLNAIWLVLGIIVVVLLRRRAPHVLASGNRLFGTGEEVV